MDMPPTRFRVVERGRRLEVIDTATRQPVTQRVDPGASGEPLLLDRIVVQAPTATRGKSIANWLPRATQFDGTASFTTRAFYDTRAPRIVQLDPTRAAIARWLPVGAVALVTILLVVVATLAWSSAPLLIVLAAMAFNPKVRERLRAGTTALIDRLTDPA